MAKTALEISEQERLGYSTSAAIEQRKARENQSVRERWLHAQDLARAAAKVLYEQFGAQKIILFGSAVKQTLYTPYSDIDLAVSGLPPVRYYAAVAAVTNLSVDICIDLIDLDHCSEILRPVIEKEGISL